MAQLVTLIVLLILAAVSLSAVFSEKGIFSRAEKAGNKYNEAKAREVLETVLLADGQYEKNTNPKYNQDDFLDDLIKSQIEGSDVKGDVAIIGDYAFELDRSVPKIGRYLGLAKDLVWPTVEITIGPTLINNGRAATFTAKATEITKGITRIELWLNGKKIDKYIETYETPQTEIIKEFTVNKNGNYTIKAYADLMGSTKTTVEGIVPAVSFSPNGSEEWKKEHTTQIIVEETAETITEMKYVWVKDNGENEPADKLFTADCLNNRTVTGGNETMTGKYYLWVMLKTGTGENIKINKYSSNAFYFDNEGPTVTLTSSPTSETSFTLTATASDDKSGVAKYELYVEGKLVEERNEGIEIEIEYEKMGEPECKLVVTDNAGNTKETLKKVRTKLHFWRKSNIGKTTIYEEQVAKDWVGYINDWYCATKDKPILSKVKEGQFEFSNIKDWTTMSSKTASNYVGWSIAEYSNANFGETPGVTLYTNQYWVVQEELDIGWHLPFATTEQSWKAEKHWLTEKRVNIEGTFIEEVKSSNYEAYPQNDTPDNKFWYTYIGIK